jgi:transposase
MLLIGYCLGICSERRLCEEVKLNLAYRWFCRLSIEDKVPDHSTFSKNRHGRFREAEAFRFVFEQVLEGCIKAGLVGGEGLPAGFPDWPGWNRVSFDIFTSVNV